MYYVISCYNVLYYIYIYITYTICIPLSLYIYIYIYAYTHVYICTHIYTCLGSPLAQLGKVGSTEALGLITIGKDALVLIIICIVYMYVYVYMHIYIYIYICLVRLGNYQDVFMVSVVDITQHFRMVSVVGFLMVSVAAGNVFLWFPSLVFFMVSVAAGNVSLWFPTRNVFLWFPSRQVTFSFYRGK